MGSWNSQRSKGTPQPSPWLTQLLACAHFPAMCTPRSCVLLHGDSHWLCSPEGPAWQSLTCTCLHLLPVPHTMNSRDAPSHCSEHQQPPEWCKAEPKLGTGARRDMGAADSKFSISRGFVCIKSCCSEARTGVSHTKISWQLFNVMAEI